MILQTAFATRAVLLLTGRGSCDTIPIKRGESMEIRLIDNGALSTDGRALTEFARKCSWQGTGEYFADCLADGAFDSTEKIAAAFDGDRVIGFAALVNESCVEDTELAPWLDFLFVDEEYRGRGIAGRLAEFLFGLARSEGIKAVYLCTVSHEEMYRKFGFDTLYKAKTVGGDCCSVMKKNIGSPLEK